MQGFLILMIAITLISVGHTTREILIARRLQQVGVLTDAVIVESGRQLSKRGGGPYLIYEFIPSGQAENIKHRQGIRLSRQIDLEKQGTSTVMVSYLADKPKISRLAGRDTDNSDRNTAIVNSLIFIVLLVGIWLLLF